MKKITKEKGIELAKRLLIYLLGLTLIAFGSNVAIISELGISPVNSIPLVLSLQFDFLSKGNWATIIFCVFILIQLLILLKHFKWYYVFQILVSFVFGWLFDLTTLPDKLIVDNYLIRLLYLLASVVIIALGVMLYLEGNIMSMPAEGVALAVSKRTKWKVSTCKIVFDVTVMATAVALSLIFFKDLKGVREGTVIAAFGVGFVMRFISKGLKKPLQRWIYKQKTEETTAKTE
jgi:uncharacterized membrane protein YczE